MDKERNHQQKADMDTQFRVKEIDNGYLVSGRADAKSFTTYCEDVSAVRSFIAVTLDNTIEKGHRTHGIL